MEQLQEKKKTAIGYARVSSDEQRRTGSSIEYQVARFQNDLPQKNINLIKIFIEDYTGKHFNRPEFDKLLSFIKENKGKIDYLYVTTWDRFGRSLEGGLNIIKVLKLLGTEVQSLDQHINFSNPNHILLLSINLALPEIQIIQSGIKITDGIKTKREMGRWTHKAPFGYDNSRDEKNLPHIIPNKYATFLTPIFQDILKGGSQQEVLTKLNKKGCSIKKSQFSKILRNLIYKGFIYHFNKQTKTTSLYKGIHKAIVPTDLFDAVQKKLTNNIFNHKKNTHKDKNLLYPLKGVLICPNPKCKLKLRGSAPKGRAQSYPYYHCVKWSHFNYPVKIVHDAFITFLTQITIPKEIGSLFLIIIKDYLRSDEYKKINTMKEMNLQIEQLKKKLNNLKNELTTEIITTREYLDIKNEIEDKLKECELKLNQIKVRKSSFENYIQYGVSVLTQLDKAYIKADYQTKKLIIGSIISGNLIFDGKNCRTTKFNPAVEIILQLINTLKIKNGNQKQLNQLMFPEVEYAGIEPVTS